MKIQAIPARRICAGQLQAWSRLQRADAAVDHPMLGPEFTQLVAGVRDDVEVAVIEQDGEAVGFLPFQRTAGNVGLPVASIVSDLQGVVIQRGVDFHPEAFLQQCGLAAWQFDHLVASQRAFQPYHGCLEDSPYMDLADGYEAYLQERRQAGCSSIRQAPRKARKLKREVGPLRFEPHAADAGLLEKLIDWKRRQLVAMQTTDVFRYGWVVELLESVRDCQTDRFSGMLSALYAGDALVAVHLGIRGDDVICSWIPTFDAQFAKYSPGLLLHLELARAAAQFGVKRIDLGRGLNQLKTSLMSDATPLALGAVDRRPINRSLRAGWYRMRELVYATPLRGAPLRMFRRLRNWMSAA